MLKIFAILAIFLLNTVDSSMNLTNSPPIFQIDDYTKCRQNNKNYCRIEIELLPIIANGNTTELWSLIEFTKHSYHHYDHSKLYYAICVEDHLQFTSNDQQFIANLNVYYSRKYEELGLKANIKQIDCGYYDNNHTLNSYDWILLYSFSAYTLFLIGTTYYHYKNSKASTTINKYLLPFSLINNFNKLVNSVGNDKLKYIQGLRFYTTILVINVHTFMSFILGYVEDTQYIEDVGNPIRNGLRCLSVYLVQTYFLLSAWFLTYNTLKIFENASKLNIKRYLFITLINRYIRIGTVQAVAIAIASSTWIYIYFEGPLKHISGDAEFRNCQNYWWMNILLINNQYSKPMCYGVTWYLSADTQLYLLSMVLLVLILKFRQWTKTIITIPICIGILIQTIVTYRHSYDIIYRMGPKYGFFFVNHEFLDIVKFYSLYMSTYSNLPTYMLGIAFGLIYYKYNKKVEFFQNNFIMSKWWLFFIGLPLLTIIVSTYQYGRLASAILSAILKPMYATGMGIGILAMSHHNNGLIKRFLEWKPALFLGNVTFSSYISHFIFVFFRTIVVTSPLRMSDWILFTASLRDIICAFLLGTYIHLVVELPTIQLQKLLVPKVKCD